MTTLRKNGGHLRVRTEWTNSVSDERRHYTCLDSNRPTLLALAAVRIYKWDELVETDFRALFERIKHAVKAENDNGVLPRKNITVLVDEVRYTVHLWGLPGNIAKSKAIKEGRRLQKLSAERVAQVQSRNRLPSIAPSGRLDDADAEEAIPSLSRKKRVTGEDVKSLRKNGAKAIVRKPEARDEDEERRDVANGYEARHSSKGIPDR